MAGVKRDSGNTFACQGYRGLALVALIASNSAWAALGKDYDNAILHTEREHYDRAIPLLQEVISEVPASLPRIRLYGMRFASYTPHYYLGLAQYRLGNCEEALLSWAREARFNVLSDDNVSNMNKGRADCEAKLVQAGRPLPVLEEGTRQQQVSFLDDAGLRALVERYFNGDYEHVSRFEPPTLSSSAARRQAWVYRAASLYTLYVLSGEADGELLAQVHASLAEAGAEEGAAAVDRSQFSPKFLKLMDQDLAR